MPRSSLRSIPIAFLLAALALGALLAWPLRHGHAYLDDFVFIALGRHIDNPLVLLVQDSIGFFFFRPLSMFLWWATVAAFGDHAPAHLIFNVAVHVANGVIVYALLRRLAISRAASAVAGLVFIAHPAGFSSAAWLSDRFDLFATFFGLLALHAVERFLEAPGARRMAAAALLMLAALFSKEIAFAFPAVATLMILWPDPGRHAATRRERVWLFVVIAACSLAALGVRPLVLRAVTETMFLRDGLVATLWGGLWKWMLNLPGFLAIAQGSVAAVAGWLAALGALLAASLLPHARAAWGRPSRARTAMLGLAIMVAAALAQAPIVHASPIVPYQLDRFLFESLAGCRFYYLPLAGFAIFLGPLIEAVLAARPGTPSGSRDSGIRLGVALALVALALIGLTATSRAIGREWAVFPEQHDTALVRSAVAQVKPRLDFKPGCKIYFLGTPPVSLPFRLLIDTAVKQALPRGHPAVGCFIQSEHAPWYHLVRTAGLAPGAEKPLESHTFHGKPYPPLAVANLSYYYLKLGDRPEIASDPNATFYALEAGRFVDVTSEVRSHKRTVRFFDNRPAF
jgi:Dolichyl-phosphate-mannose-protein mannosyltransferase